MYNLFKELYADAVIWKATKLFDVKDGDHDGYAEAIEEMATTLTCIENEVKRSGYVEEIQKRFKIKNSLLKKQVAGIFKDQENKRQEKIAKAKFESQFSRAEDAGLPADFEGNVFDAIKYSIYEYDGVYYTKGARGDYPVTNFTMSILYHSDTGEETAFRLIAIKNVWGFECVINFNTDDFVSLGTFKKIIARRGNYVFKGTDSDLTRLQEMLQKDEKKTKFVGALGYQKSGFWAWGNGIVPLKNDDQISFISIDEHGIVDHNKKHYFIPAGSQIYAEKDNMFLNEKKFIYRTPHDGIDFKKWNRLFLGAYQEKAIAATLFYIGSLFRDIVMKRLQRYPILNLFGPPQAGKGKMAESLMTMFGEGQAQIMLGGASTAVGFMRKFGQLINALVWLDEYKNGLNFKIQESIKNIYDGIGYERGKMTNDLQTESTPVLSSCILSGQELPTGEAALFTRIILLAFDDGKSRPAKQRQAFDELKSLELDGGFPYITGHIVQYRELVEKNFEKEFKSIQYDLSRRLVEPKIDDRFIDNISMLLAFRKIFNGVLDFAFTYEEAEQYMIENIQHHQILKAGNDDVSKFWQVVETLFFQNIIYEGRDFMLEDGYIFIRVQQVHPFYVKEMIQRRDLNYLAKPTLEHYMQLDKSIYGGRERKRFKDGSNSWCYKMKYNKLNIDLIRIDGDNLTDDQKAAQLDLKQREMNGELKKGDLFTPIEGEAF